MPPVAVRDSQQQVDGDEQRSPRAVLPNVVPLVCEQVAFDAACRDDDEADRHRDAIGSQHQPREPSRGGYQVLFDADGNLCTGPTDPGCPPNFTIAVVPVRRTPAYLDALPSVQLRFRLPHDAAIRASYGRGISRPNYGDLPPTFSAQGNNNEVDIGNPDLKPSRANNYDLLYEKYLKPLGLLQGGFFFKQLSNPIYESVKSVLTPSLAQQYGIDPNSTYVTDGWVLARPLNGKSATVYGFEIAYQQHLSFLPGPFSGVGLSANYGYTHSTTTGVPLGTDTPALPRQAPNSWNISPTYDRGRVSARWVFLTTTRTSSATTTRT